MLRDWSIVRTPVFVCCPVGRPLGRLEPEEYNGPQVNLPLFLEEAKCLREPLRVAGLTLVGAVAHLCFTRRNAHQVGNPGNPNPQPPQLLQDQDWAMVALDLNRPSRALACFRVDL